MPCLSDALSPSCPVGAVHRGSACSPLQSPGRTMRPLPPRPCCTEASGTGGRVWRLVRLARISPGSMPVSVVSMRRPPPLQTVYAAFLMASISKSARSLAWAGSRSADPARSTCDPVRRRRRQAAQRCVRRANPEGDSRNRKGAIQSAFVTDGSHIYGSSPTEFFLSRMGPLPLGTGPVQGRAAMLGRYTRACSH